jgi:hypothetical protein
MSETIKVAKVKDEYTIVINKGYNNGIKEGQNFLIYEVGEEIFDPDTNESLGRLEVIKGKGVVINVQEKISTIESNEFDTYKVNRSKNPFVVNIFDTPEVEEKKRYIPFRGIKEGDLLRRIYT